MKPLKKIFANTTYILPVYYLDSAKAPIDLTGASAELILKKSLHSNEAIKKTGIIDVATGGITFEIQPEDTANILEERDSAKYFIGAILTLNGKKIILFQTTVEIVKSIA